MLQCTIILSELVRLGAESIAPSQTMEDNREHKDSSLDSGKQDFIVCVFVRYNFPAVH